MDSNHRPHAYQACALTSWAMNPFCRASARKYLPLRVWWRLAGSNRWPPACRAGALPAELNPQNFISQKLWYKIIVLRYAATELNLAECGVPNKTKAPKKMRACLLKTSRRKRKVSVSTENGWQIYQLLSSLLPKRRWSSRTFRYGYLVTTSPQSSVLP